MGQAGSSIRAGAQKMAEWLKQGAVHSVTNLAFHQIEVKLTGAQAQGKSPVCHHTEFVFDSARSDMMAAVSAQHVPEWPEQGGLHF